MNNVFLTGRLTKDIEVQVTDKSEGTMFTLAVQETKDKCHFIPCSAWGSSCTFLDKYAGKGDLIGLVGRITTYKDNKGNYKWGVVVEKVEILSKKKN